jgi:hypothetical protein
LVPIHRGRAGLVRRSFGVVVLPFILRWYFQVHGVATTWGFSTKVFTLTAVTGVRKLSLVCVTFHGEVDVLLENSYDAINENHNNFSRTQSLSFLKIFDNLGSLFLKRIIRTLRRLKRPKGGSPARTTRINARCRASSDFSLTSSYPWALRIPELLRGMRTTIYIKSIFFSSW